MAVYIIYFILIVIVPFFYGQDKNGRNRALLFLCTLLYAIFALKAPSVGCDISGYKIIYEQTGDYHFWQFDYNYMEFGYKLLMKLFFNCGFSFQAFTWVIYFVVVASIYSVIKLYSEDLTSSLLYYYSLTLFVFECSGLRQALAMSICLFAFIVLDKGNKKNNILFFLLVLFASTIHRSALGFICVFFFKHFRRSKLLYLALISLLVFSALNKSFFITYAQTSELSNYEYNEGLEIGGLFVFEFLIFIASCFCFKSYTNTEAKDRYLTILLTVGFGLVLMFVFRGSILMRAASYYTFFNIVLIPTLLKKIYGIGMGLVKILYIAFMFVMFYYFVLEPNTLGIVPYRFFFSEFQ